MAIYSLHHSSIGKGTQARTYTAAAHLRYITREKAASLVAAARLPGGPAKAGAFMVAHEDRLRSNGRVADKLMIALPRELDAGERHALVRDFAEEVTDGRATWIAAFHDKGKDARNPHCHLILIDRDVETGRRVFGTSERGSTERLRALWETHANRALERARRPERIDRRTLAAQGKARRPTIHIGVRSAQLVRRRADIQSRPRQLRNSCLAATRSRRVAYPDIDAGKSRFAFNVDVRRRAFLASQAEEREAEYWRDFDKDALMRDIRVLRGLHAVLEYSDDGRDLHRSRDRSGPMLDAGPEL